METRTYEKLAMSLKKKERDFGLDIALGKTMYDYDVLFAAMGISGEAGELLDAIKKQIFHNRWENNNEFIDKIADELGDVLWYCAAMCDAMGVTMETVMLLNLEKLNKRYTEGYSDKAAAEKGELTKKGPPVSPDILEDGKENG